MTLTDDDERAILDALADHRAEVQAFFGPASLRPRDRFLGGLPFDMAMALDFCKALATLAGGLAGAKALIASALGLFRWLRAKDPEQPAPAHPATVRERVLVMLFDAHVSHDAALDPVQAAYRLGVTDEVVRACMAALQANGLARETAAGHWRFVTARRA
ncbi:MAG: hypothetical protein ACT4OK_14570 [Gemmobacter sp.]